MKANLLWCFILNHSALSIITFYTAVVSWNCAFTDSLKYIYLFFKSQSWGRHAWQHGQHSFIFVLQPDFQLKLHAIHKPFLKCDNPVTQPGKTLFFFFFKFVALKYTSPYNPASTISLPGSELLHFCLPEVWGSSWPLSAHCHRPAWSSPSAAPTSSH